MAVVDRLRDSGPCSLQIGSIAMHLVLENHAADKVEEFDDGKIIM
jgi:hypothetical protein